MLPYNLLFHLKDILLEVFQYKLKKPKPPKPLYYYSLWLHKIPLSRYHQISFIFLWFRLFSVFYHYKQFQQTSSSIHMAFKNCTMILWLLHTVLRWIHRSGTSKRIVRSSAMLLQTNSPFQSPTGNL